MDGGGVTQHMLFLGFGYTAEALARRLDRSQWQVSGTSRTVTGLESVEARGVRGILFDRGLLLPEDITHIVSSIPPDEKGDPVIRRLGNELGKLATKLKWVAYLSTTGVYGDHGGGWVDETTPFTPNTERGERRLMAEEQWLALHRSHGLPLHIFRLAGIYGPGRNALQNLRDGKAKRVIKPGQLFSRIHVEDIAGVLLASMAKPHPGRAYNVSDDEPCPPQDVVTFGAALLGITPPPETAIEEAELSPMARSFYADSKRVSNARIKNELGYTLHYPSYREGLRGLI
jgi:nucleoside-diphosphate-sugar epimerase